MLQLHPLILFYLTEALGKDDQCRLFLLYDMLEDKKAPADLLGYYAMKYRDDLSYWAAKNPNCPNYAKVQVTLMGTKPLLLPTNTRRHYS